MSVYTNTLDIQDGIYIKFESRKLSETVFISEPTHFTGVTYLDVFTHRQAQGERSYRDENFLGYRPVLISRKRGTDPWE